MLWDDGKDGVEIGGKTVTPATTRLYGDETLAQKYIGVARNILGSLKQQMDLGGLKSQYTDVKLEDGTKIRAKSNMWGLADIDEIWIDVTGSSSTVADSDAVLGFIVQGFRNRYDDFGKVYYQAKTPSKKKFDNFDSIVTLEELEDFTGYSDNNAKYIAMIDYSNITNDYTNASIMQKIYVSNLRFTHSFHSSYGETGIDGADPGFPPIGGNWKFSDTLEITSGACGPEHTWEEASNPCLGSTIVSYTDPVTHQIISEQINLFLSGYMYTGGHDDGVFGCSRSVGLLAGPWDEVGMSSGDWLFQLSSHSKYVQQTTVIPVFDELSRSALDSQVAYLTQGSPDYYRYFPLYEKVTYQVIGNIYRRNDGHGFCTETGFFFNKNVITLTNPNNDQKHGSGCFFMIPLNNEKKIKFHDNIVNENNYQITYNANLDAVGAGSVPDYCCNYHDFFGDSPNLISIKDATLTDTQDALYTCNDLFAIPCNVEKGVHEVTVWGGGYLDYVDVWLLTRNKGYIKKRIKANDGAFVSSNGEYQSIQIKVGEFTNEDEIIKFTGFDYPFFYPNG